jgi:RNA polymerase sigma-B factor
MSSSFGQRAGTEREQLIESHLPLVQTIARRYAGRGESVEDLVQVGALGLIRASDRFEPGRGVTFATFATPAIEGEIRRHLGDQTSPVRIPRELQRRARHLSSARDRLRESLGRPPSVQELAAASGVEVEDIEGALEAQRVREPADVPTDGVEAEEPLSAESSDDRLLLARGARVLNERERRIVLLRFHRDLTERQIADELGISQAHVSRLLSRSLAKLRAELNAEAPNASTSRLGDVGASQEHPDLGDEGQGSHARRQPAKRKAASGSSGRFLVRMPGALHEQLTQAAEREHVSLNRFITETLSESVSGGAEREEPEAETKDVVAKPDRSSRFRMLLVANIVVILLAALVAITLVVLALNRGI